MHSYNNDCFMRVIHSVLMISVAVCIAGCATTTDIYRASGEKTICHARDYDPGYIVVLPEAAWRHDQKEPDKRQVMALEEIKKSFQDIPCGKLMLPGGIKEFSNWSATPESELLKQFSEEGVDTIILLRIEELTPRLYFTFSLPILWGGSNEVDFRIRALAVKTGTVVTDMRVKRASGGPFNIRPAEWSRDELNGALHDILGKEIIDSPHDLASGYVHKDTLVRT